MDAIEALKTRRSCRSYKPQPIKDEELQTIIDCGLNAPNGMNTQLAKIIVVQDIDKIKKLSAMNAKIMGKENVDPFYGAPVCCMIVVPEDPGYGNGAESFKLNPVKDGSLIIGAMQTAAWALGIGSCWINRCKEMLELPEGKEIMQQLGLENYVGVGCCILGYPDNNPSQKKIKEGRVIKY